MSRGQPKAKAPESLRDALVIENPEPEWLVEGLIRRGAVTILAGPPKRQKGLVATALAAAVASGKEFAERATTGGEVVFTDLQNGLNVITNRFRQVGVADPDALQWDVHIAVDLDQLEQHEQKLHEGGPVLWVCSPLNGGFEVDDVETMVARIEWFHSVAVSTNAAVLLVYRQPTDPKQAPRGSWALQGMCSAWLQVEDPVGAAACMEGATPVIQPSGDCDPTPLPLWHVLGLGPAEELRKFATALGHSSGTQRPTPVDPE